MRTVVVVDDEPIVRMDLCGMLEKIGFQVAGEAGDGFDAVESCREHRPDVVLMDVKMPVFDGLSASETILRENLAGCVVLLTAFDDMEIIERAKRVGVSGYLMKPVNPRTLLPTIEVALSQSDRLRKSQEEAKTAEHQLADSRLIHQAQLLLARQENLGESEAYRKMRQLSMDKRISIAKLAEAIVQQAKQNDPVAIVKSYLMEKKGLSSAAAYKRITDRAAANGCSREAAAEQMRQEMEEQA